MTLKLILELLIRNWKFILFIVVFGLLMLFVNISGNLREDIKQLKVAHKLEVTELKAEYVETARDIERKAYAQQIQAVNEYKEREQVLIADAASANDAVDSLSDTIQTLSAVADKDANFRIEYSNTTGKLLQTCSGEYSRLARTTDSIANNLRLIEEANRRN